jgi:hypothetical protein
MTINPMQSAHDAPRCKAKSKRTGKPCRAPAVRGCRVCRMHGARGGAPEGKRNGASLTDSGLLEKLRAKGIDKFIAYELPLDLVKKRYGGHFDIAMQDLNESDDLRVVDFSGERAFRLFHLKELGTPVLYESSERA